MTTSAAILCESLGPPVRERRPLSPRAWTCVGVFSIPLWATWPALALRALEMPAFECLTIAFFCGWIALGCTRRTTGADESKLTPQTPWLSWVPAIACALGLCGSNAFHILATHYIPAAEANLISYLWPVMIVGIGAILGLFRLRPRQIVGLVLGFTGAVILMGGGAMAVSLEGIALALLSGISWALYCVFRLKWKAAAGPVLTRGCALSAGMCLGAHLLFESTVPPSAGGIAAAAAVGILPLAFGNLLWDEGFRRGDSQLLAVMAYATPLCSALLLAVLGLESLTWTLGLGALVIVAAGLLSRSD
jgi:drug/metabolite transporter (DMT)-like permease